MIEFDPLEQGRQTGMKDIHGNPVFEGDTIRNLNAGGKIGVVRKLNRYWIWVEDKGTSWTGIPEGTSSDPRCGIEKLNEGMSIQG